MMKKIFAIAGMIALLLASPSAGAVEVQVVEAEQQSEANKPIVGALQNLLQGIAKGDENAIESCLSEQVTFCDTSKGTVRYGKKDVMDHIRKNVLGTASGGAGAAKKIVLENPFVTMKGDTAMVSFHAMKEMGGDRPVKLESWCSEVFEKSGDQWKVLHFQSNWKPAKVSKQS